jgi:restriction endonuclease S subunit
MAGEWREYRIGEIADIVGGSTPSTADPSNFNGDIPWLTPKDLSGPHDRYVSRGERNLSRKGLESCSAQLLPAGTVLVTSRAPIGYAAIAKNPIATNQGFRNLIPKPGFDSEFLYYWVKAHVEELQRYASGSTFQELTGTALAQIRICVPPLPEQRAIAHILGTLDDKIELNRRMSETLEAMGRALFKAWFVDFEPVRAKMEGRWQRGQSLPGLPAHLYDLFPDRLVESQLGEIPEGWEVKRIGDLAEVFGGSTPRTDRSEYWEGGTHHWVTPKDLSALSVPVLLDTERKITDAGLSQISSGLLPKGTVLLSSRAPIGYLAIAEVPVAVKSGIHRDEAASGDIEPVPVALGQCGSGGDRQPCKRLDISGNQQVKLQDHSRRLALILHHERLRPYFASDVSQGR